jgi:predicted lipoprotein with Yx(FWY)xxD motif
MFRPMPLLVGAALALVALGGYDVLRGTPEPVAALPAAAVPAPLELTASFAPIGEVVTSSGVTLYRFDKDTAKPAKSNCTGQCAATWPPVLAADGEPKLTGIDAALVGIAVRSDGTRQLTLAGWPLYRYTGDTAPGQTSGEGVGGSWHAVGPLGKPAVAASRSAKQPSDSAGSSDAAGSADSAGPSDAAGSSDLGGADSGSVQGAVPAPAPAPQPAPAPDPEPSDSGGGYGY